MVLFNFLFLFLEKIIIKKTGKAIKINKTEHNILELNRKKHENKTLNLEDKKDQVSIFGDYLETYLFNCKVKYYKKILFNNHKEIKNLFYEYNKDPDFLDIIYLKNTSFFANVVHIIYCF